VKTEVAIRKKNGFVYLLIFAVTDGQPQEIGKVFAGTENAVPRGTGKGLLKKVSAHGPFLRSPGDRDKLVTIPAKTAEIILASRQAR
jgi:hypothetical protein